MHSHHKIFAAFIICLALPISACKKNQPEVVPRVKKVVRVQNIDTKFIEQGDGSQYGMGENLYNRLITKLQNSEHFVVVVNEKPVIGNRSLIGSIANKAQDPNDRYHFEFAPFVAANFQAEINGLGFAHGSKGAKKFHGFHSEFKTPWNSGALAAKNEFIPPSLSEVSLFARTFEPQGSDFNNSITGVGAGEAGELNLLIASMHYRRDKFFANTQIDTKISYVDNSQKIKRIETNGSGFFFAFGLKIFGIGGEFTLAKNTAFQASFNAAADALAEHIKSDLALIPFRTKVETILGQEIIINAGKREGLQAGDSFVLLQNGNRYKYLVKEVFQIGAIVECSTSKCPITVGDILTIESELPAPTKANALLATTKQNANIETSRIIVDPPEFSDPDNTASDALAKKSSLLLPYELWRWARYDQSIEQNPALDTNKNLIASIDQTTHLQNLNISETWQKSLQKNELPGHGITVAVIDSGLDYNHPALAHAFSRSYAGYDFISNDERPFDDNSHGTAIAGLIAGNGKKIIGVAPGAHLLSYKVFDPYGETNSAAIYAATERAIADGAKIIVFAWSTYLRTEALSAAITLAEEKNILVVVSVGNRGLNLSQSPQYPSSLSHSNLIRVAAIDANENILQSSEGSSNFSAASADIATYAQLLTTASPRGEICQRSGADMAAAIVAGATALVWANNPSWQATEVKESLLNNSRQSSALSSYIAQGRILQLAQ